MKSNSEKQFILRAVELGKEAMETNTGGPFGALIVMNNKIVGVGKNLVTSQNDPTAHAEINAIRDTCKKLETFNLEGGVLYTSSEPCPMCLGAILWAKLDRVVFSTSRLDVSKIADFNDKLFYDEVSSSWGKRKIDHFRILTNEGLELLKSWKLKPDKIKY